MSRDHILSNLHQPSFSPHVAEGKGARRSDGATTIGVHVCSTLVWLVTHRLGSL